MRDIRIAVVGGAGHVGLPLSLLLVEQGFSVAVIDADIAKVDALRRGEFPFLEEGGPELLRRHKDDEHLRLATNYEPLREADAVILTISTPVDEHLNPDLRQIHRLIDQMRAYLRDGQVIILRSTVYPGTSENIAAYLREAGLRVGVSFCPERIAQGKALRELVDLPQIISGSDENALSTARAIFSTFAREIIEVSMEEAELAKLFTNAWRYIKFAAANQFYMIAAAKGLDFYRVRDAMVRNYSRAADFPTAGFAAGPCLFKDTMQLASFYRQNFRVGHAAVLVNETLPDFLVEQIKRRRNLSRAKVGILGMAFKADNDDHRDSLAYKLRKILQHEGADVFCTDPFIQDPSFLPLEDVLGRADILIIGCPHSAYRALDFRDREVVDCWGLTRRSPAGG